MSDSPSPRAGVLCAGSMLVDLAKEIDAYPPLDGLAMIERVFRSTGGAALNMAVDLRLLGADFPVELLGAVGGDEHAAYILGECARLRIDTSEVRRLDGVPTSFSDVMVERPTGRRTFFHYVGANASFDASTADLERPRARILHAGAPGVLRSMDAPVAEGGNGWSALLQRARAAGMHTNLELASVGRERMAEVVLSCLPHVDSLVINELEAGALTGVEAPMPHVDDPVDWQAVEAIALRLIELGVSTLAVVHFPAGCVAAAPDGRTWRQGSVRVPPEEIRSATGAGDAFAAGVVLGLHERWPVERCLRLGVAAAAACVRSPTTSGGIRATDACLAAADAAGHRPVERPAGATTR
jgi:sugar/nucleoside kinase (ribokinase family)